MYEGASVGKATLRILPGDQAEGCVAGDLQPHAQAQAATGIGVD